MRLGHQLYVTLLPSTPLHRRFRSIAMFRPVKRGFEEPNIDQAQSTKTRRSKSLNMSTTGAKPIYCPTEASGGFLELQRPGYPYESLQIIVKHEAFVFLQNYSACANVHFVEAPAYVDHAQTATQASNSQAMNDPLPSNRVELAVPQMNVYESTKTGDEAVRARTELVHRATTSTGTLTRSMRVRSKMRTATLEHESHNSTTKILLHLMRLTDTPRSTSCRRPKPRPLPQRTREASIR